MTKPDFCRSCSWTESELRRRVISNGSIQIVHQCLNCGRSAGNPFKHSDVKKPHLLPPWNESLAEEYDQRRASSRTGEREEWFAEHNAYLASKEWKAKRQKVLDRCGGLCEGCREASVDHIHHLSYEHWKNELLWELVGVCEACHHRAHKVVKFVGAGK